MKSEEQSINIQHFISNPGLHHLAENIFRFVDNPTLAKCRGVSKEWNYFLEKIWLLRHLNWFLTEKKFAISTSLGGVKTMTEINKEWSVILYYLEKPSSTIEDLIEVNDFLQSIIYEDYTLFGPIHRPLLYAASKNQLNFLKVMAKIPINFNPTNYYGYNVLFQACLDGRTEIVDFLLEIAPMKKIDLMDKTFSTVLHAACRGKNVEIAKILIDNSKQVGLDLKQVNVFGFSALDLAKKYVELGNKNFVQIVTLLQS